MQSPYSELISPLILLLLIHLPELKKETLNPDKHPFCFPADIHALFTDKEIKQ